jgi:hypothetical protein
MNMQLTPLFICCTAPAACIQWLTGKERLGEAGRTHYILSTPLPSLPTFIYGQLYTELRREQPETVVSG